MMKRMMSIAAMLMVTGLMQANIGRSQGEIRLDTRGNTVKLDGRVECHYNANTDRVICRIGSKEVREFRGVRVVKQHPGTRRATENYIGMYGYSEGPGMGEYTYIYAK